MATETERLIAIFEARMSGFEKAMAKAQGTTNRTFTAIERRGRQMETRMSALGKGIGGAFAAGLSVDAAQRLLDTATRIRNALKVTGLEGDKLRAVYDRLFQSAQRNAQPVEALVDLYSRLSLVQGELGVSQDELLTFSDRIAVALRVSGKSAAEASGALLQLSQALGGGVVRAEEFNSVIEGATPIAQAAAAGLQEAGGSVARLRQLVVDGRVSSEAFFRAFLAGSEQLQAKVASSETTISSAFVRLQNVLVDVAMRFDDSTGASRKLAEFMGGDLAEAIKEIGRLFTGLGEGPIADFMTWVDKAVDKAVQGAADIGKAVGADRVGAAFGAEPYIGQGRIQDRIDGAFAGIDYSTPKQGRNPTELTADKPNTVVKPITLADYPVGGNGGGIAKAAGEHMAVGLIKKFEGFIAKSKWDVNAYRVGFGSDTTTDANGRISRVTSSTVTTLADANRDLARRIAEFQSVIKSQIGGETWASFSEEQQAALTSVAYNYGELPGRIVRAIEQGKPGQIGQAIRDLGGDNGGINRGRRAQEADMFFSGSGGGDASVVAAGRQHEQMVRGLQSEYSVLGSIASTALDGIARALEDGKIEGNELLGILLDIVKQILTMPALNFGGGGFGGGGFLSSLFGAIFHEGGKVGGGGVGRHVSASAFVGAPRLHRGGVMPGERPAILKPGEIVDPGDGSVFRKHFGGIGPMAISVNVAGASGDQHIVDLVRQGVQAGVSQLDKSLNGRNLLGRMQNAQMRYG